MENNFNSETFETWNKMADLYQSKLGNLTIYNDTYDFICESLTKNRAKILDVGCGPANISNYILSKRPDFIIHGVDISHNMIEIAKKNIPNATFYVMDCRKINAIQEQFDVILSGFCLPYLSEKEAKNFILDSYNLLNENGYLYISFVNGYIENSGFKSSSYGRVYFYYHNLENIKNYLYSLNFKDINVFEIEFRKDPKEIHTIVIANKI